MNISMLQRIFSGIPVVLGLTTGMYDPSLFVFVTITSSKSIVVSISILTISIIIIVLMLMWPLRATSDVPATL